MLHHLGRLKMRRRQFLSALGVTAALSPTAATIAPSLIGNQPQALTVPTPNFPRPRFSFGEEVVAPWFDDDGTCRNDRGEKIIGMLHNSTTYEVTGWCYLLRWTYKPSQFWLIGRDDGDFIPEQDLKAFDG